MAVKKKDKSIEQDKNSTNSVDVTEIKPLKNSVILGDTLLYNPFMFSNDKRKHKINRIGELINKYTEICVDSFFWKYEDYDKRLKTSKELKGIRKDIDDLLKLLIPARATNKKTKPVIRLLKDNPKRFISKVEGYELKVKKYLKRPYLDYEKPDDDIKTLCRKEFKIKDPDKIIENMLKDESDRSNRTIAISIMAHQIGVSFAYLYEIYNDALKDLDN